MKSKQKNKIKNKEGKQVRKKSFAVPPRMSDPRPLVKSLAIK